MTVVYNTVLSDGFFDVTAPLSACCTSVMSGGLQDILDEPQVVAKTITHRPSAAPE